MKIREEVLWFAEQMEIELRKHDDRPGWKGDKITDLMDHLEDEF